MTLKFSGGPELRIRLDAVATASFDAICRSWRTQAAAEMRATAPSRTGHLKASIRPGKISEKKADIQGDFWAIFTDRGTKAHDIWRNQKRGESTKTGRPKALRFGTGGDTIFARKVHHRRTARRPFLSIAARNGLRGWSDQVVQIWNRKRETQRWRASQ